MSRSRLVRLAIVTAALAGANIAQGVGILTSYWWTAQLPRSELFRSALYALWLPIAVLASACGLVAAFHLAQARRRAERPLLIFAWAFTLVMKVDGYELGWSFLRFAINVGYERLAIGVNLVGVAILLWLLWFELGSHLQPDIASAVVNDDPMGSHVA